ncbi:MAG: hypothetical protein IJ795_02230 [Bacteroidales bacterium]|nr:hypothetical protein [Bacteroidales bacterium]
MNKKTLILCLSAIGVMIAATAVLIAGLYRTPDSSSERDVRRAASGGHALLEAVPSDAVMIMACDDAGRIFDMLGDSTKVWSAFFTDNGKRGFSSLVRKASGLMKRSPAVISVHYSGEFTPLLIVKASKDTTYDMSVLMAAADSLGLKARLSDCEQAEGGLKGWTLLEISWSETLISSSRRHIADGLSVLDKGSFSEAAAIAGGEDAVFFSHEYASRIFAYCLHRPYYESWRFFSELADWSVWTINGDRIKAGAACREHSPEYYASMLESVPASETTLSGAVPATTMLAVSWPGSDIGKYLSSYRSWLDAAGKLGKWDAADKARKDSTGLTASAWAVKLDIKEAGKAAIRTDNGIVPIVLLRPGNTSIIPGASDKTPSARPWPWPGFVARIFGGLFDSASQNSFILKDGWIVIGESSVLEKYASGDLPGYSLKAFCEDNGISLPRQSGPMAWFSPSEGRDMLETIFEKPMASALKESMEGIAARPMLLWFKDTQATLATKRIRVPQVTTSLAASADTTVEIPAGPFKVTNCATGKTNTFSQAPNLTLSLRDENGKSLWGVPFKGKICGRVSDIDWFANGKIQFIFASGSKLWLIDRLGRFVSPFPTEIGKEIRLGPDIYDFSGAKGYSAMLLFKDNSLGLYDLHGKVREGWKGIKPESTIKDLPELLTVKGQKFWAVRTSLGTIVYPFDGGEALTKATGDKMFRSDAALQVKDGSVSGTCHDGKTRSVKLVK